MVNSPGFKKFVKDFDIKYGVTETTGALGTNQENYILDGDALTIMYHSQIKLSTSYGSNISNFTINGTGPRSTSSTGNEYGGATEFGTPYEDNIGLGWSIINSSASTGDASEDSADPFETGHENSHGIGFLINDTLYSTEFISSDVEVTSGDLVVNFIIKNAEKIAKEQNISVTKVDTTLPPVENNPYPLPGLSFEEIEPSGDLI